MNIVHIDGESKYVTVCAFLASKEQEKKIIPPSQNSPVVDIAGVKPVGYWCQDKGLADQYKAAGIPEIKQVDVDAWLASAMKKPADAPVDPAVPPETA